jgi:hypothetical protein
MGWEGMGCVVNPGLVRAPSAGGGEIDAEWAGSAVGGQNFVEAVT